MLSALSKTMVRGIGRLNAHRLKGVGLTLARGHKVPIKWIRHNPHDAGPRVDCDNSTQRGEISRYERH
jgi:hypothetical protein